MAARRALLNVSQHLGRLLSGRVVHRERQGKTLRYSVTDRNLDPLCDLVCGFLQATGEPEFPWRERVM